MSDLISSSNSTGVIDPPAPPPPDRSAAMDVYRTTRSMSDTLIRLRPLFNQDLDQLVVYMVFLLGPLHQDTGSGGDHASRQGLNALSISQITGIARESTRRKLRGLETAGFIIRGLDGLWRLDGPFGVKDLTAALRPLIEVLGKVAAPPSGFSSGLDPSSPPSAALRPLLDAIGKAPTMPPSTPIARRPDQKDTPEPIQAV